MAQYVVSIHFAPQNCITTQRHIDVIQNVIPTLRVYGRNSKYSYSGIQIGQ